MGRQHVGHNEIAAFAQEKVNLPKDEADEYRALGESCDLALMLLCETASTAGNTFAAA